MNQTPRQSNECLIDFLRFSLPDASMEKVADLLGITLSDFTLEKKGVPLPPTILTIPLQILSFTKVTTTIIC